jgi:hypothetical protein
MAGCVMKQDTLLERVLALPSVDYTERRVRLPDRPGLYFAIGKNSEILYIGMSRHSIRGRWKASFHDGACQIEKRGLEDQARIAYIVYADTVRLVEDEKAAIRTFSPTFNYSHVPGAYERAYRRRAEECRYINCHEHYHETIPQLAPPTDWDVCDCGTPECALYPGLKRPAP